MSSLDEKKAALVLLIKQSVLIEQSKKEKLLSKVGEMNESDVEAMGVFLALEVKHAQKFYQENLPQLDALVEKLNQIDTQ